MEDNNSNLVEPIGKIPRSKDNAFDISQLSMREFEAFMIFLIHDGEVQSTLKQLIDLEFNHKSSTKGYDYINNLCREKVIKEETPGKPPIIRPAFAKKKTTIVKGKQETRIYVRSTIRKKYEKFILPTINSLNDSINDIIKEYTKSIKEEEKIRDKFKAYTETIILALNDLLTDTPAKILSSKRFQKKMNAKIWKYYRSEVLKYEVFSK